MNLNILLTSSVTFSSWWKKKSFLFLPWNFENFCSFDNQAVDLLDHTFMVDYKTFGHHDNSYLLKLAEWKYCEISNERITYLLHLFSCSATRVSARLVACLVSSVLPIWVCFHLLWRWIHLAVPDIHRVPYSLAGILKMRLQHHNLSSPWKKTTWWHHWLLERQPKRMEPLLWMMVSS